nr:MAG TPA: hypothetical protein [Caudoviricetes sp.]
MWIDDNYKEELDWMAEKLKSYIENLLKVPVTMMNVEQSASIPALFQTLEHLCENGACTNKAECERRR